MPVPPLDKYLLISLNMLAGPDLTIISCHQYNNPIVSRLWSSPTTLQNGLILCFHAQSRVQTHIVELMKLFLDEEWHNLCGAGTKWCLAGWSNGNYGHTWWKRINEQLTTLTTLFTLIIVAFLKGQIQQKPSLFKHWTLQGVAFFASHTSIWRNMNCMKAENHWCAIYARDKNPLMFLYGTKVICSALLSPKDLLVVEGTEEACNHKSRTWGAEWP